MAVKKYSFKIKAEHEGERIDQILAHELPTLMGSPISRGKVRKLIMIGAVYLNKSRNKIASKPGKTNALVEVVVNPNLLFDESIRREKFELSPANVAYEDKHIIVVDKPSNFPTQPTLDNSRDNLFESLKRFLTKREDKKDIYVGLHHRLDHGTSGLVLFTKMREANVGVSELFKNHKIQKTYLALTHFKETQNSWTTDNYLKKDPGSKKQMRMIPTSSGGDRAITHFKILERLPKALLIQAQPQTGRTHQIRVHLSECGLPIWGDLAYGNSKENPKAQRLMLHAHKLKFEHPITQKHIEVTAPTPMDFKTLLAQLSQSAQ